MRRSPRLPKAHEVKARDAAHSCDLLAWSPSSPTPKAEHERKKKDRAANNRLVTQCVCTKDDSMFPSFGTLGKVGARLRGECAFSSPCVCSFSACPAIKKKKKRTNE